MRLYILTFVLALFSCSICAAATANYRCDFNYGYYFTKSLYIKICYEEIDLREDDIKILVNAFLKPILEQKEISIIHEDIASDGIEYRLRIKNNELLSPSGYFQNHEIYNVAETKVKDLFDIAKDIFDIVAIQGNWKLKELILLRL